MRKSLRIYIRSFYTLLILNDPSSAGFVNITTYGPFYVGDVNRGGATEPRNGPVWVFGHPNRAGGAASQGVLYFPGPNGDGSLQPV